MSLYADKLGMFTDELLQQLSDVVYNNGWQNSGGIIQFAPAVASLRNVLAELRAAEAEGLGDELPMSLQTTLNGRLANIISNANAIIGGSQNVPAFTDEVDRLHLDVWTGGFRYRGKRVLGYEAKYQQLNQIAEELEGLRAERKRGQEVLNELVAARQATTSEIQALQENMQAAAEQLATVNQIHEQATEASSELDAKVQIVTQKATEASESAATAEARAQSASTSEKRLNQFVQKVDDNEKRLNDAVTASAKALADNERALSEFRSNEETVLSDLLSRLAEVELDITEKLSRATGYTLFHAFDARKSAIKGWGWLLAAGVTLAGMAIAAYCLLQGAKSLDVAFFTKLGFTLPAAVVVGFALKQYGRERRLQEEYAFKSAISLSLEPYRKLVEEAVDKLTPDDRGRFADFLVTSIGRIFESPTDRVFGDRRTHGPSDSKVLSSALQMAKEISDIARPK